MFKLIFLLIPFAVCSLTYAQDQFQVQDSESLSSIYKQETLSLLNQMQDAGLSTLSCKDNYKGCLYVEELMREAENGVVWKEQESFHKPDLASRWGAFYSPQEKSIYLNQSAAHSPEFIGFLGLHELLGALGHEEKDFEVTMPVLLYLKTQQNLTILAKDWTSNFERIQSLQRVRESLKNIIQTPSKYDNESTDIDRANERLEVSKGEGGGVIVGGGGDTRTLTLRLEALNYLSDRIFIISKTPTKISPFFKLTQYLDLPLEVSQEVGDQVNYQFEQGKLKVILVPQNLLNYKLKKALEDIEWALGSIPARAVRSFVDYSSAGFPRVTLGLSIYKDEVHPAVYKAIWKPLGLSCAKWSGSCEP